MIKKREQASTVTLVGYASVVEEEMAYNSKWMVTGIQPSGRNTSLRQVILTRLELGRKKDDRR